MEVKKFYDEFTEKPLDKKGCERFILRMKKSASFGKDGFVLDVGCRNGSLRKFLPTGSRYIGVDITSKWWDRSFDFIIADATHLPFKVNTFDEVFALEIIEHLFIPKKFLKEVHCCLKSDGHLVISTPNIVCLLNRFKVAFGRLPSYFDSASGHLHCFTYYSLVEMFNPLFKVIRREPTYVLLPLRRLTNRVPTLLLKLVAQLFPNLCDHLLLYAKVIK